MKKSFLALVLLSAISVVLAGCEMDPTKSPSDTSKTETKSKITDTDLENAIKNKFNDDAQLKAANLGVDANIDRNEVTISGTVGSQALRTRAVELARSAHSGVVVNDKIDVTPREISRADYTEEKAREARAKAKERGETVGASLDDAWIHTKIVAKLIGNPDTPQRKINVDVNNNIVTLRGTVATAAEKAEAEQVAKSTEGVKRVVNQLRVTG
ncbi:MAG: BON domain-containing protein [Acidobacteria bacterium]|nr:BON domain-containing protein [Acidobacteriota bacterium]